MVHTQGALNCAPNCRGYKTVVVSRNIVCATRPQTCEKRAQEGRKSSALCSPDPLFFLVLTKMSGLRPLTVQHSRCPWDESSELPDATTVPQNNCGDSGTHWSSQLRVSVLRCGRLRGRHGMCPPLQRVQDGCRKYFLCLILGKQ